MSIVKGRKGICCPRLLRCQRHSRERAWREAIKVLEGHMLEAYAGGLVYLRGASSEARIERLAVSGWKARAMYATTA